MTPLTRKLLRDLRRQKGQVVTIALVVGCGVAAFVGLRSTYDSLIDSRDAYYERYRMAEVFASAERVPEHVADRLAALPEVALVYTRIVEDVRLPVEGIAEPAAGHIVSLPESGRPLLNDVYLRSGRWIDPARDDEVLLLEAFANANRLRPGDSVEAVINGKLRRLRVAGLALSPEYVFAARMGSATSDDRRFAVLWMSRRVLAATFDQRGSFNDVVLRLQPGASELAAVAAVDRILEPYGGFGAIPRSRQLSNYILTGELAQLEQLATTIPVILLAVAAFLLNVVLSRLIGLQRPDIATLKAVGYPDRVIGAHFAAFVAVILVLGMAVGVGAGAWFGTWMTELYAGFFRFPVLSFRVAPGLVATGSLVAAVAGAAGAFGAVRAVVRLPPAEAMLPPAPTRYRKTLVERLGLRAVVGPAGMMVVREINRRPIRTLLSAFGIATGVAVLVMGRFSFDSMEYLLEALFDRQFRQDITVTFNHPVPARAEAEVARIPGVLRAEGAHASYARVSRGNQWRDVALYALRDDAVLRLVSDWRGNQRALPVGGVLLTQKLGEILGVGPGDAIDLELREGRHREHTLVVAGLVDEGMGLQAYATFDTFSRLTREERSLTGVVIQVDRGREDAVIAELLRSPFVAALDTKRAMLQSIRDQTGETIYVITFVVSAFAITIAIGVVYNNARIALAQRSRDLASLRVLGFTRREISWVLISEMVVQIALAIPLGMWMGKGWAEFIVSGMDPETFRLPAIVSRQTYLFAVAIVLLSGLAAALFVRRKLDHLDLIEVLKTRE